MVLSSLQILNFNTAPKPIWCFLLVPFDDQGIRIARSQMRVNSISKRWICVVKLNRDQPVHAKQNQLTDLSLLFSLCHIVVYLGFLGVQKTCPAIF